MTKLTDKVDKVSMDFVNRRLVERYFFGNNKKPVKYKNYAIRVIKEQCLIAIPLKAKCFYVPIQLGVLKDIEELKKVIKYETKPKKR